MKVRCAYPITIIMSPRLYWIAWQYLNNKVELQNCIVTSNIYSYTVVCVCIACKASFGSKMCFIFLTKSKSPQKSWHRNISRLIIILLPVHDCWVNTCPKALKRNKNYLQIKKAIKTIITSFYLWTFWDHPPQT